MNKIKKGFTLIELLIVIAILGALAAIVLVALNPAQQLARARDASRIAEVTEIGHSMEVYATDNGGNYVAENATWITSLVTSGAIQTAPGTVTYSIPTAACTTNIQNNLCYDATAATGTAPAVVFTAMESSSQNSKCAAATPVAFAVYSTADGRTGIVCKAGVTQPTPGTQTFLP